ncbi:MAG: trypsin-like peptidase domain-containing protein, partial [Chthoniobacteraceae bacterium]|nr:trypsin-like peptidase domain-containing protein [Chthoniobacteraceae bacterium]
MHPRRPRFVRPVVILLLGGMFTASGLCADVTLSVAEIAAAVRPSLVTVTQVGREGPNGSGSGFVISGEGLIATNRHVIGQGQRLRVETSDGRKHDVTEIVASDAQMDLA